MSKAIAISEFSYAPGKSYSQAAAVFVGYEDHLSALIAFGQKCGKSFEIVPTYLQNHCQLKIKEGDWYRWYEAHDVEVYAAPTPVGAA